MQPIGYPVNRVLELPTSGIAAFICNELKVVYVFFSMNLLEYTAKEIQLLKQGLHASQELQSIVSHADNRVGLVFLEETTDKSRYNYWVTDYVNRGYIDLRKGYTPIKYKVKTKIIAAISGKKYVHVFLESSRKDRIVVGVFNTMEDAQSFINDVYRGSSCPCIVYASNELTRKYRSGLDGDDIYKTTAD